MDKNIAIFSFFVLTDAVDLAEGFDGGGTMEANEVKHLVGHDDIGWYQLLFGQLPPEGPQLLEKLFALLLVE